MTILKTNESENVMTRHISPNFITHDTYNIFIILLQNMKHRNSVVL